MRRSQRNRYHSATLPVRLAFATEKATRSPIIPSPYGLEEVDQGVNGEEQEEIVTEFEEEDIGVSAMVMFTLCQVIMHINKLLLESGVK